MDEHPWREWAEASADGDMTRMPGGQSRWSAGKDLSWEPLRIERVCEVKYDHMQGPRFRHAAVFPALAVRQAARGLPLRSARGHGALRAFEGLRRQVDGSTPAHSFGVSSGSSASCAGRSSSGTCCRLMRIRVQVLNRPRIASTRTSAGSRCAAASGWRAFHRSTPASASSFFGARPISISGCFRLRSSSFAASTAARAAARPPASCSSAATARRPGPRAPVSPTARAGDRASRDARRCRRGDRRSSANRAGIVASVKSAGSQSSTSSQVSGADTRASGGGAHRIGARDRAVLRVLVVVEEHAVALFLPPLAGRQAGRAPLDLAREGERGAAHLVEAPAALDPHVDVDAARAGRLRPADQAEVVERGADHRRDVADLRPLDARHRIEIDAQLVGMIEIVGADRMRVELEARPGWPSRRARRRRAARLPRPCGRTES